MENIIRVKERGIEFALRDKEGLATGFARLSVISTESQEVLADADVA